VLLQQQEEDQQDL